MGMVLIVVDSLALMLGSLLAAGVMTSSVWLVANKVHRPWVALLLLAVMLGGLLASPLEQSLFVRMMTVFSLVGGMLLSAVVWERAVTGRMHPHM